MSVAKICHKTKFPFSYSVTLDRFLPMVFNCIFLVKISNINYSKELSQFSRYIHCDNSGLELGLYFSKIKIQAITLVLLIKISWKCVISLQTIDWVLRIEDDLFPVIAGELGDSKESTQHYKKKLDEFMPTMKV